MIHYYTQPVSNGIYGLSRTAKLLLDNIPNSTHYVQDPEPGDYLGYACVYVWHRWGKVAHPSHALNIQDSIPGNDVVTVADLISWQQKAFYKAAGWSVKWLLYKESLIRKSLKKAKRVIATSKASARDVSEWGHRVDHVIPILISPELSRLRGANHTKRDSFYLIVGDNNPRKRWELAVDAAAANGKTLVWVGHLVKDAPSVAYADRVQAYATKKGVELYRHHDAPDRLLAEFYGRASALLCPSKWEGFNLPIVEALSFGLPVVALADDSEASYLKDNFRELIPKAESPLSIEDELDYEPLDVYDELGGSSRFENVQAHIEAHQKVYDSLPEH